MSQVRIFLNSILSHVLNSSTFLKALSALGRRDVDNGSGHEEGLQARNLFHLFETLMNVVNLRDVVPGGLAARDADTNGIQPLTPVQLLGLALLSSPSTSSPSTE
jgi:hypothetical protein